PLVKAGVRDFEPGLGQAQVVVEQEVEVARARAERRAAARAAEGALDLEQGEQECVRRQLGLERGGGVEEARLVEVADRIGLSERGDRGELELAVRPERVEGRAEHRLAVAEVRAEA